MLFNPKMLYYANGEKYYPQYYHKTKENIYKIIVFKKVSKKDIDSLK